MGEREILLLGGGWVQGESWICCHSAEWLVALFRNWKKEKEEEVGEKRGRQVGARLEAQFGHAESLGGTPGHLIIWAMEVET